MQEIQSEQCLKSIYESTTEELLVLANSVGQTPLQAINLIINGDVRKVYLKLEGANPSGSMKDRTGYALIEYLEKQGRLNKDAVIIESTSGNLGVALAFQCKARGYPFVAIIDPKTTQENIWKMHMLEAQLITVQDPDTQGSYLLSRLERVQELCARHKNYVWTDQYSSPANPDIHYIGTGPEIYQQMYGKVGAVFVPVSTGGTLSGIGRFFRKVSPSTHIVGVDAHGSVVFGSVPAPRKLTGIGSSRPSTFLRDSIYTTHILISDEEAFSFCHELFTTTGIKVGGSSGAVLAACAQYLTTHPELENALCLCADGGENYDSTIFSNEWLQLHRLSIAQKHLGGVQIRL